MNDPFALICNYRGCDKQPRFGVKVHRRSDALLSGITVAACRDHVADMIDHFIEELDADDDNYAITTVLL